MKKFIFVVVMCLTLSAQAKAFYAGFMDGKYYDSSNGSFAFYCFMDNNCYDQKGGFKGNKNDLLGIAPNTAPVSTNSSQAPKFEFIGDPYVASLFNRDSNGNGNPSAILKVNVNSSTFHYDPSGLRVNCLPPTVRNSVTDLVNDVSASDNVVTATIHSNYYLGDYSCQFTYFGGSTSTPVSFTFK